MKYNVTLPGSICKEMLILYLWVLFRFSPSRGMNLYFLPKRSIFWGLYQLDNFFISSWQWRESPYRFLVWRILLLIENKHEITFLLELIITLGGLRERLLLPHLFFFLFYEWFYSGQNKVYPDFKVRRSLFWTASQWQQWCFEGVGVKGIIGKKLVVIKCHSKVLRGGYLEISGENRKQDEQWTVSIIRICLMIFYESYLEINNELLPLQWFFETLNLFHVYSIWKIHRCISPSGR